MKKVIFVVVIFMLILSGCKSKVDNNVVVEVDTSTEAIVIEPELKENEDMIIRGTLYTIADSGLINDITVKDAFDGKVLDFSLSEYIESGLTENLEKLYFDDKKIEKTSDTEYLYQVKVIIGNTEYTLDFYVSEQGPFICLNEQWETINCNDTIYEIIEIIHGFVIRPEEAEVIKLSDAQVIEYFANLIEQSKDTEPKEIEAGRIQLCTLQDKMDNWNPENPVIQSYIEVNISNEWLSQLLKEIELSYLAAPFSTADDMEIINAEFNIRVIYEAHELKITASDSALYIRTYINGDNYRIKVADKAVYNTFIEMMDSNTKVFDFDDITDTEHITLYYVKDADLKDFPNNKRLSEKKITDKDVIVKIVQAVIQNSVRFPTCPSREGADLIFHTLDRDIYFKIKNPITQDENNLQQYNEEPTIIAEGYFWYSCPEAYEILMEYFKEH